MVASEIIGITLSAAAVLVLLGACWVALRGLGGISALRIGHNELQAGLERIDERITREVKTRAGLARAELAIEEADIATQAQQVLAVQAPNVTQMPRPSRVRARRR